MLRKIRSRAQAEGDANQEKQFVPENWSSNCVFKFCDDLVDRCYSVINQLWRLSPLDCAIGPMGSD